MSGISRTGGGDNRISSWPTDRLNSKHGDDWLSKEGARGCRAWVTAPQSRAAGVVGRRRRCDLGLAIRASWPSGHVTTPDHTRNNAHVDIAPLSFIVAV